MVVTIDHNAKYPEVKRPENICEISEDIYYVNLDKAEIDSIESRIHEIAEAKGVIFDMRGYPAGNHDVMRYMIEQPIRSAKWNVPQIIYPDLENTLFSYI